MSDTTEKFKAIFLSLLMVLSVVAGVVALGGTAAAAPSGTITDNTSSDVVTQGARTVVGDLSYNQTGNVTNVTVNLAGGANASNVTSDDVTQLQVSLYDDTGGLLANQTVNYNAQPKTVDFGAGNVTNVARVEVTAEVGFDAENNDTIDANVTVTDAAGGSTGPVDTGETQVVSTNINAYLSGQVQDTNGDPVGNVTIDVIDLDTGTVRINDIVTRSDGSWGPIKTAPGNYTAVLDEPAGQNKFDDFSTEVTLEAGETEKIQTTLEPNLFADRITVVPKEETVFAGQEITYTVTVFDQNGNPLPNTQVTANVLNQPPVTVVGSTVKTTDANGQVTFNVTSDLVASSVIDFTARNASGGDDPTTTATANFILSGEGSVEGQVYEETTTDTLANASVWAVLDSQYETNRRFNRVDISGDDDPYVWVRLVDNSSGAIIDNDEYDVRNEEYNLTGVIDANADTGIRKIEEMNVSNAREGEGFVVVDKDGDGLVAFNHTRLAPEDYYAQFSWDAPNASDKRVRDDGVGQTGPVAGNTNFFNVTSANANGEITNVGGTNPVVFQPTANLTLGAAKRLSNQAGANLVDAPGFINFAGKNTAGTNENGDFLLTRLYTDFQAGRGYVIVATKPGYSTDFADLFVEADGDTQINVDSSDQEALTLKFEGAEPARVNITQIGTHPPLAQTGGVDPTQITPFPAQGQTQLDDPFQRISRDGTVDVMEVETLTEKGNRINGTAIVEMDEYFGDLDGQFAVLGGTIQKKIDEDTVELVTGQDGVATLLYIADTGPVDVDVNKTATLKNDPTAIDNSNATFVGITEFESASISGFTTDRDDTPVPESVAYVDRFTFAGNDKRFQFTPVDAPARDTPGFGEWITNSSKKFLVELQEFNTTSNQFETVRSTTVNISTLDSYDYDEFENDFPSVNVLPGARAGPAGGWDFYDNTTAQAEYTLDPLPAQAGTFDGFQVETQYRIEGVRIDEPGLTDNDIAGVDANDGRASVVPNTTDDANLVFPFAVDLADFQLSQLEAPQNVTQGKNITVSTTVTNDGGLQQNSKTVAFRVDLNQDGVLSSEETLASTELELAPGTSDTVQFEIPTDNVQPGTYTHGFVVPAEGDELTGIVTIESGQGGALAPYTNDQGVVTDDGLSRAIDDWVTGEIGDDLLQQVIDAWVTGEPVN